MKTLLWLDDKRDPWAPDWVKNYSPIGFPCRIVWVKNYRGFTKWIIKNGLPDAICFDHDLSDIKLNLIGFFFKRQPLFREKTGYDCAKWLVNYCIDNNLDLPKWNIQSSNTPGRDNINGILNSFLKHVQSTRN